MLEPLYKPLHRVVYPLNLVGYGIGFYNLQNITNLKDREITGIGIILISVSLAMTALQDIVPEIYKTLKKDKQGDVFWETIGPYNFRKG